MSGAFESILLSPSLSKNKMFMETGFLVNGGHDGYNNSATVVSDGATANRAQIQGPFDAVNNPRGYVAGAASLTLPKVVTVPTGNPVADAILVGYSSSSTSLSVSNSLSVYISTSGSLNILAWASFGSAYRQFAWSGFRAAYSGQTIFLKITLTQGTTNPVVEINGVNVSANFSLTTATPPAWLEASMVPTYRLVGYNWPSGPAPIVTPILGQTSAADDAFYLQTGKWPAWVVAGGSAAEIITDSNSRSFTSSAGLWVGEGGTVTASGGVGVFTGGSQYYMSSGVLGNVAPSNTIGAAYLITFDLTENSSGLVISGYIGSAQGLGTATVGPQSFVIYANSVGRLNLVLGGFSSATFKIDNFSIKRLGALSLPGLQPCNVVDDLTTIGDNCALLVGMTPIPNRNVERIADQTITSGNEQLMGGSVFRGTSQDYIKSWTIINSGGTTTVSLGNISGGAQYASAVSCPTGTTVITLLSNVPLTTNLWCNANTTAKLLHVIEAYRTV